VISTALWHRIISLLKHNKKGYSVTAVQIQTGNWHYSIRQHIQDGSRENFIPLISVYQEFWEGTFSQYSISVYYLYYENCRARQIHVGILATSNRQHKDINETYLNGKLYVILMY
jgi:hypothetical protein